MPRVDFYVLPDQRANGRALLACPRHVWAGRALAFVNLAWVTIVLLGAALGPFDPYKPILYAAGPIACYRVITQLHELLAPRMLGGFLLLIANPILASARLVRWHGASDLTLVMTVLMYVWVVIGMALVLSPHLFRRWTLLVADSPPRCRAAGFAGLVFGTFLIYLGVVVYP